MGIYESIFKGTDYFLLCQTEKGGNCSSQDIDSISQVDRLLAQAPSPDLYKQRLMLQTEFNLLSTKHTTNLLNKTCHKVYEHGEKIGKILVHQLRQRSAAQCISEITDQALNMSTSLK